MILSRGNGVKGKLNLNNLFNNLFNTKKIKFKNKCFDKKYWIIYMQDVQHIQQTQIKTIKFNIEYELEDIINFLEPEYIDYLEELPNELWNKYRKDIESAIILKNNYQIILYTANKLKLKNLHKTFSKINIKKVSLEYFKYVYETCSYQIDLMIEKNKKIILDIFLIALTNKNIEFNEYLCLNFIEKFELKIELEKILINLFVYNFKTKDIKSTKVQNLYDIYVFENKTHLNVLEYYINLLNFDINYVIKFHKELKSKNKLIVCDEFQRYLIHNNITKFEDIKQIQKLLKLSNEEMHILIKYNDSSYNFMYKLLLDDVNNFYNVINEYNIILDNLTNDVQIQIFISHLYSACLKNSNFILDLMSKIIKFIESNTKKKIDPIVFDSVLNKFIHYSTHLNANKVIYELMKLGAKIDKKFDRNKNYNKFYLYQQSLIFDILE